MPAEKTHLSSPHLSRKGALPYQPQPCEYPAATAQAPRSTAPASSPFVQHLIAEQATLLRYAFSLTKDLPSAEDLVQDTALRALANQQKFVENVNFRGWLATIMRNIFINNYQGRLRRWELFDYNTDPATLTIPAQGSHFAPEDAFCLGEIYGAIEQLSDSNRVPFRMFIEGYKYSEIAEQLDIPIGTVKSRIFLARKALQRDLRELKL